MKKKENVERQQEKKTHEENNINVDQPSHHRYTMLTQKQKKAHTQRTIFNIGARNKGKRNV